MRICQDVGGLTNYSITTLQAVSLYYKAVLLVEEFFPNPQRTETCGSGCASVKQTLMYCCQKEKCPMQRERFAAVPAPGFLFLNVIFPDSAACVVPLPDGFPPAG